MKNVLFLLLTIVSVTLVNAQEKKTILQKAEDLGNKLIGQPDAGVDTTVDKIMTDNLYITVDPLWRQKGSMIFNDYKLNKTNEEPLVNTLPFPEKKLIQNITINLINQKKPVSDKRNATLALIKTHLTAYYKEAGKSISPKELDALVQSMIVSTEQFTTTQGKTGELLILNDIQAQKSEYIILLLIPGADASSTTYAQFTYTRFVYETEFPEEIMEWRPFIYQDEEQEYINFTKKILKTLVIK